MKRKIILVLLTAILASGMIFIGCDLFEKGTDNDAGPETFEPLIIMAKLITGEDVVIEISTTRIVPRVVLTPMNGDTYVITRLNGVEISRGTIQVNETHLVFKPSNGGISFTVDYVKGADNVTLFEVPDEGGGVTPVEPTPPGGGGSGSSGGGGGGGGNPVRPTVVPDVTIAVTGSATGTVVSLWGDDNRLKPLNGIKNSKLNPDPFEEPKYPQIWAMTINDASKNGTTPYRTEYGVVALGLTLTPKTGIILKDYEHARVSVAVSGVANAIDKAYLVSDNGTNDVYEHIKTGFIGGYKSNGDDLKTMTSLTFFATEIGTYTLTFAFEIFDETIAQPAWVAVGGAITTKYITVQAALANKTIGVGVRGNEPATTKAAKPEEVSDIKEGVLEPGDNAWEAKFWGKTGKDTAAYIGEDKGGLPLTYNTFLDSEPAPNEGDSLVVLVDLKMGAEADAFLLVTDGDSIYETIKTGFIGLASPGAGAKYSGENGLKTMGSLVFLATKPGTYKIDFRLVKIPDRNDEFDDEDDDDFKGYTREKIASMVTSQNPAVAEGSITITVTN